MRDGVMRSFTAPLKSEAENLASAWIAAGDREKKVGPTVEDAINKYIDAKRNVLSPTTITAYDKYSRLYFDSIKSIPVSLLTSYDIQQFINETAGAVNAAGRKLSAKSIRNIYGLLSGAVHMFRPDFLINVTLPRPVKQFRDLPNPALLVSAVRGTDIELPTLMAMWMSLTASEICGVKVSSIHGDVLEIDEVKVRTAAGWIAKKAAKEFTRNRRVRIPPYIMELIKQTDAWKAGAGYIEPRTGQALYERFVRVTQKAGLSLRFHDCRHYFASISASLNIPEKTIMAEGGWASPHVMKSIYTETFEQDRLKNRTVLDDYFTSLFVSNSCQTDRKYISENGRFVSEPVENGPSVLPADKEKPHI